MSRLTLADPSPLDPSGGGGGGRRLPPAIRRQPGLGAAPAAGVPHRAAGHGSLADAAVAARPAAGGAGDGLHGHRTAATRPAGPARRPACPGELVIG